MAIDPKELLAAQLRDGLAISRKRPFFLGFLDEQGAALCEDLLKRERGIQGLFWGGYDEAERKLLGLFPDYLEPDISLFPLSPLTFYYRTEDRLSHRDFLGSFMGLGIERDVVGDILVTEGRCTAFIRSEMENYFCETIRKIGRTGVRMVRGAEEPLPIQHEFQEISGVIASPRIDSIVALLCRTSREKASELITTGRVMQNHREVLSVSAQIKEGDVLSVRKQGKFIIDRLGPFTSKGRLAVQCRKYR